MLQEYKRQSGSLIFYEGFQEIWGLAWEILNADWNFEEKNPWFYVLVLFKMNEAANSCYSHYIL